MTRKKKEELAERSCAQCKKRFTPRRKDMAYCSDVCRSKAHSLIRSTIVYEHKALKFHGQEIPLMPDRKTREQYLGKFYEEIEGTHCVYCGQEADASDHVVPLRAMELLYTQSLLYNIPMYRSELVPACTTCNSIAGDKVFQNRVEKTRWIHLRRKEKNLPTYIPTPGLDLEAAPKKVTKAGELDICANCSLPFKAERNGQKFCSSKCLASWKPL